ncbi:MAG: hypothetical protein AB1797_00615 [bacterium]
MATDELWREYDYLFKLEQKLNKTRWTVFVAFLSVSFIVACLVLKEMATLGPLFGKCGMTFGWLVFMAGFYHYWWFHRRAHELRNRMCELEKKLAISVFIIRTNRPQLWGMKIYYHWAVDTMAIAYTFILIILLVR